MYKVIERQKEYRHQSFCFEKFENSFPTFAQASAYLGKRYREILVDDEIGEWKRWYGANLKGMCFEVELKEMREATETNIVVYIEKA